VEELSGPCRLFLRRFELVFFADEVLKEIASTLNILEMGRFDLLILSVLGCLLENYVDVGFH